MYSLPSSSLSSSPSLSPSLSFLSPSPYHSTFLSVISLPLFPSLCLSPSLYPSLPSSLPLPHLSISFYVSIVSLSISLCLSPSPCPSLPLSCFSLPIWIFFLLSLFFSANFSISNFLLFFCFLQCLLISISWALCVAY